VARAADYYLDSSMGMDSRAGTSEAAAWRTVAPLREVDLGPGDHVYFKRGGAFDTVNSSGSNAWDPGLLIESSSSGSSGSPVTLTSYGSGALPSIFNSRDGAGASAITLRGAYIVLDGLLFNNTRGSAVLIEESATHAVVTQCESNRVGSAVTTYGEYTLITRNYFHDGTIIVNTPGGYDDYGANGVIVFSSNVEISYNRAERLKTPSYDFTFDGGFVELAGTFDDVSIHHNDVRDSMGFFEGGNGDQRRITVAYNLSVSNGGFSGFHIGDEFGGTVSGMLIANNTIVETEETSPVFWVSSAPPAGSFTVQNNIIVSPGGQIYSNPGATVHTHNRYPSGSTLGVSLGTAESVGSAGFVPGGYHLAAGSAAIDVGTAAPYATDLDGVPVPTGAGVDFGAYEYVVPGTDAGVAPVDLGVAPIDLGTSMDLGAASDLGPMLDMGVPPLDAGLLGDGGTQLDSDIPDATPPLQGGCSCNAAAGSAVPRASLALLMLALLAISLRRRRA